MTDKPFRVLPKVTPENEHFWRGGAEGELRFTRCQACGWYVHPTSPVCRRCRSRDLAIETVSGLGTVHAATVNHQPWIPTFDPPYSVAVIELDEQPGLRLTTNVIGCAPEDVAIGMRVRVTFDHYEENGYEVWLPMFEPTAPETPIATAPPIAGAVVPEPRPFGRFAQLSSDRGERKAIVSGIGQSDVGRRLYRDPLELTVDACLEAIADAGLTVDDIDGVATYPGNLEVPPGFSGAGVTEIQEALGLQLNWFAGGMELPGQLGSVVNAILAVSAGLCDHVLCFRTVWEASAQGDQGRAGIGQGMGGGGAFRASGFLQWTLPYGAASAANWIAMMADRHFHEFGTTREQLAWIAITERANAALNPKAVYTDPMSLDDYLSARMISTPLCLFDCDAPADGSTAVVISRAEHAAGLDHPAAAVEAVGTALHGRPSWDNFDDLTTMALRDASAMLWQRTDLTPSDVEVAELYDGFSFIALCWLEALGFCGKGEGGAFIDGGTRIARDGVLPLNTHGGQLSAGRLHGYGFLHEACTQLWGRGGARQVERDGGRAPQVAVAAAGGGPLAGCLLLSNGR